jgi:serine/threonine protein kinase
MVDLPFIVDFTFLEKGIFIHGDWYPVVKMDWVEGLTLNEFVTSNLAKTRIIGVLSRLWLKLGKRLHQAGIAHGDLQHGNIMLVPGSTARSLAIKLVDYDAMYVPALADLPSGEVGHPAYQHPERLRDRIYSSEADRFPLLVIYCALMALRTGGQALWDRYDNGDNLLFREQDFQSPSGSSIFNELLDSGREVQWLAALLRQAAQKHFGEVPLLEDVLVHKPYPLPSVDSNGAAEQATSETGSQGSASSHAIESPAPEVYAVEPAKPSSGALAWKPEPAVEEVIRRRVKWGLMAASFALLGVVVPLAAVIWISSKLNTRTLLSCSSSGRQILLTARIQADGPATKNKPTGTVTFRTSRDLLGICTLDERSTAQLKAPLLPDGVTLIADYSGDRGFMSSTGTCQSIPRRQTTTSIDVMVKESILAGNRRVTVVATVKPLPFAGQLPTGIVTFRADGSYFATSPLDRTGRAEAQLPAFRSASRSLTVEAHYGGDGQFKSSDGRSVYIATENRITTVTVLTIMIDGTKLTVTAVISAVEPEIAVVSGTEHGRIEPVRAVPTGTVFFFTKGRSFGRRAIINGSAILILTPPLDAPTEIVAHYSGDRNFAPSEGREAVTPKKERPEIMNDIPAKEGDGPESKGQESKEKGGEITDDKLPKKSLTTLALQDIERAKELLKQGKRDLAKKWFRKAMERLPDSDIAEKAREKLSELGEDK